MGHSGCMLKSVMLPLSSIGTWGWGWKSIKGNQEKVLRHKNHLSVLFYSHIILNKPCTFPTYTVINVTYRSNMVFYALTYARFLYFLFQTFYLLRNILKWDMATIALSHLVSDYYTGRGNKCRRSYFLLISRFLQQMTQKFHCWIFLHEK